MQIKKVLNIVMIFCVAFPLLAQEDQPAQEAPPLQSLVLSIQYGKGGPIQEFRLNSGEAVFVQTGAPQNRTSQHNPQEVKELDAYRQQEGQISQSIADKITAIQRKQKELDTEIFPTYRAPLDVEVKALKHDLELLEAQRDQLQSQKVAKDAQKPLQPSPPPSTVATGLTVRATIAGNSANLSIRTQGKDATTTTVQAPINAWVQIFSGEKGQGQDIWAKVAPISQ